MPLVLFAYSLDPLDGAAIADPAAQRVTGIRRVRDDGAVANIRDDLSDPMGLWIRWMYFDQSGHRRIVGEPCARA